MSSDQYLARPNQLLSVHSHSVAELAGRFIASMGKDVEKMTYAVGLLHDIGKSAGRWQSYITGNRRSSGIKHSVAGTCCIRDLFGDTMVSRVLSNVIAGHHAGLPDYGSGNGDVGKTLISSLNRCNYKTNCVDESIRNCADLVDEICGDKELYACLTAANAGITPKNFHAYVRLIASALVDADHLDAELSEHPSNMPKRGFDVTMRDLLDAYNRYCAGEVKESNTVRGRQRREIKEKCIDVALTDYGDKRIYKLCAPTGSGKTLSSLAFALNHAVKFGKERVIYVVPYISIIEQTADLFRRIFDEEVVIEHHSKFDIASCYEDEDQISRYQNAIENWDAPIIVTTANQFWETCLAAKTKQIRKFHNVINSVVVVDEVQTLPNHAVNAAMGSIKCLASIAKTTFLLMTATMPDYSSYGDVNMWKPFLERLSENESVDIIQPKKAAEYFSVNPPIYFEWIKDSDDFGTVAAEICGESSDVLVITNTRLICRTMYDGVLSRLPADEQNSVYHLSNTMCSEHISLQLTEIRKRLKENREKREKGERVTPIRVISTSLVEAGVDLDFPVVYRELVGLDSIIQAAGRCNREGKYTYGKVRVFNSLYRLKEKDDGTLDREYLVYAQPGITAMTRVLRGYDVSDLDVLLRDPGFIQRYYTQLLRDVDEGEYGNLIRSQKCEVPFRSVGERFRLIPEQTVSILVHYSKEADDLIERLKDNETWPKRDIIRKLRRYTISVYPDSAEFKALWGRRALLPLSGYDGLYEQQALLVPYRERTGLDLWNRSLSLVI